MTQLLSPGTSVTISTTPMYSGSTAGTVPLIVIATAANKLSSSGAGIAPYTTSAYANVVYEASSQRDLLQTFGTPTFYTSGGTSLNGYELNEYGLHAAYKYLSIWSKAYVLRADIDLAALAPSVTPQNSNPTSGTYWFDLSATSFGVFVSNGNRLAGAAWVNKQVTVLTSSSQLSAGVPLSSIGSNGQFAIDTTTTANTLYEKVSGAWVAVGSTAWKSANPTIVSGSANPANLLSTDSFTINGTAITFSAAANLTTVAAAITTAAVANITATVVSNTLVLTNTTGGPITLANAAGTPLATLGLAIGTTKGISLYWTNDASYPQGSTSGDVWIKGSAANNGAKWVVRYFSSATSNWTVLTAPLYPFNGALSDGDPSKDAAALAALGSIAVGTIYVGYDTTLNAQVIRRWNGTQYQTLTYTASTTAPVGATPDKSLWYNTNFQVDIMVGTGTNWEGYRNVYPSTDANGVIISGSAPTLQSGGDALVDDDLWIDSSDTEDYPALYRWNATTLTWVSVDLTDHTTPFGIVFADARQDSGVTYTGIPTSTYAFGSTAAVDLLESNFVDPDAPDPRLYPSGVLLFNTRYSTYNVKEWNTAWFKSGFSTTDYTATNYTVGSSTFTFPSTSAGRWVTVSGLQENGAPFMGRKAQRSMVVQAMVAALNSNDNILSDAIYFNLMAAPGYPELLSTFATFNKAQNQISFTIGDTPARLNSSSNSIQAWANNIENATATGDLGLTAADPYTALYYPWGLDTNFDGSTVFVPPSTAALLVYGYNDQVGYPWLAPAGPQRGVVNNFTSVGYLNASGNYQPVILNPGQLGTLYTNKINPIQYIPNQGYAIMGQKTLDSTSDELDRVNNARLANYLAFNLPLLVQPFLFQQNDAQTWTAVTLVVTQFMNGLLGLNAFEDFAVLCDASNNLPATRGQNQLWVDIAIQVMEAVEFIYIPVRMLAPGTLSGS